MSEWLSHPAVQAGLVPFAVALVLGAALARTRALAAAVASGVAAVLTLTIGFSLEPFTSVRKALLVAAVTTALGLALDLARIAPRRVAAALAVLAGLGAVWAIGRVLAQQEGAAPWLAGALGFAFVGIVTASALAAGTASTLRAAVVGTALGWGAGILALLGASALLAQIALAAGSASAAVALVVLLRGRESPLGWTLVVPAATTASLVGVVVVATGELKGWTLAPLLLVPAAAGFATPAAARGAPLDGEAKTRWILALRIGLAALLPAALAALLAWRSAVPAASS